MYKQASDAQGVLMFDRLVFPEDGDFTTPQLQIGNFPSPPAADRPRPFRAFRIRVTPDEVVVHMKPRPDAAEIETHRVTREPFSPEDRRTWPSRLKKFAERMGAPTENLPVLPWTPRAAVGVFAELSTVAVRNVTITPNPSGDRP
jgi:hypothetical protein